MCFVCCLFADFALLYFFIFVWSNLPSFKLFLPYLGGSCLVFILCFFAVGCFEQTMVCNTGSWVDISLLECQMLAIFKWSLFCFVWFGFPCFCSSWFFGCCCCYVVLLWSLLMICCCFCFVVVVILIELTLL